MHPFGDRKRHTMPTKAEVALFKKQKAACIRYLTAQPSLTPANVTSVVKAFESTSDTSTRALVETLAGLGVRLSAVMMTCAANHFNGTSASSVATPTPVSSVGTPPLLLRLPGVPEAADALRAGNPLYLSMFFFFHSFFHIGPPPRLLRFPDVPEDVVDLRAGDPRYLSMFFFFHSFFLTCYSSIHIPSPFSHFLCFLSSLF